MTSQPSLFLPSESKLSRRQVAWLAALFTPAVLAPGWWTVWQVWAKDPIPLLGTVTGMILVLVSAAACYTDCRWLRVPNWITYSAALWGFGINTAASWLAPAGEYPNWLGAIGLMESVAGFALLFTILLVVFSFSGGGAGDVKLAGAIGSLLGVELGFQALMYSFVVAGISLAGWIIWTQGPATVATTLGRQIGYRLAPWLVNPPSDSNLGIMRQPVALGPFFAIGVLIVLGGVVDRAASLFSSF